MIKVTAPSNIHMNTAKSSITFAMEEKNDKLIEMLFLI